MDIHPRYQILFLYLTCITISTKCEVDLKKTEGKPDLETKILEKSIQTLQGNASENDNVSFMTKLSRWIYPPTNLLKRKNDKDQISASAEFGGYQYLPPPSTYINDHDKDCSPCDLEPWIPVVGHSKHRYLPHKISSPIHSIDSVLINNEYSGLYGKPPKVEYGAPKPQNYFQSDDFGALKLDYVPLKPILQYGPPKPQYGPPKPQYGPPKPQYGPPKPDYIPPKPNYGPPKPDYGPPKPEYGAPKPNYGPPIFNYGPPKPDYIEPKPDYGPPKPLYGPPKQQYGPPKNINSIFGSSPTLSGDLFLVDYMMPPPLHFKLPSLNYGPPKNSYGPPPQQSYGPPPQQSYGPPPQQSHGPPPQQSYGPPPPQSYGPPPQQSYGPPLQQSNGPPPQQSHGPPPIKPFYGPPAPKPLYIPPSSKYGSPNREYGPPIQDFTPPKPEYGPPVAYNPPPKQEPGLPSSIFNPPLPDQSHIQFPPSAQNIPQPVAQSFSNFNNLQDPLPRDFIPDSLSSVGNSAPQLTDNSATGLSNIPLDNGFIPPPVPSDSYGNPVNGDSLDFNSQFDSLPAPSGDNEHPSSNGHIGLQNNYLGLQNAQQNFLNIQNAQLQLPNLSPVPVLPQYEFRNFHGQQNSQDQNVQVQQSVKVADYIASVEHPINIVQSPLVELQINEEPDQNYENNLSYNRNAKTHYPNDKNNLENFKLSENPIVVEDNQSAASNIKNNITLPEDFRKRNVEKELGFPSGRASNDTFRINKAQDEADLIKQLLIDNGILGNPETKVLGIKKVTQNTTFKPPKMDYNDWIPKFHPPILSSSRVPPTLSNKPEWAQSTTQKPVQIIIPYTKQIPQPNNKNPMNRYTTLVPMYTPPMPTESSDWHKYLSNNFENTKLNKVTEKSSLKTSTAVYNINDLIVSNSIRRPIGEKLPYDIISLQKNIDDWTHQSFSHGNNNSNQVAPPKQIPVDFFTTKLLPGINSNSNDNFDHQSAESTKKETAVDTDIQTNIIVAAESATQEDTTEEDTSSPENTEENQIQNDKKSSWKSTHITVNLNTKEKVYVVTPQAYSFVTASPAKAWSMAPKIQNGTSNNTTLDTKRFSIRIEPQNRESREKMQKNKKSAFKVIYSEWPHLINNLQTTTPKPTSGHPLFGLMGITAYTPPPNSSVETFVGHSKVVTVVTPSSKSSQSTSVTATTPKSSIDR